jgi:molybdenum cofactor biosynthesis enzyme MoaA
LFCENLNVCSSVNQSLIDQIQIGLLSTTEEHRQSAQTSIQEVKKAVNQIKSRKDQGTDEVTVNIVKGGGEPVIRWFLEFFTDVCENEPYGEGVERGNSNQIILK